MGKPFSTIEANPIFIGRVAEWIAADVANLLAEWQQTSDLTPSQRLRIALAVQVVIDEQEAMGLR